MLPSAWMVPEVGAGHQPNVQTRLASAHRLARGGRLRTPAMSLLDRVRRAAPAALFQRGALYARDGGVQGAGERFVVRVPGRVDAQSVWTDGEDWECDCGAEVEACAHVAAVAIAAAEGLVAAGSPALAGIRYHLRRHDAGLIFDRTAPAGAPRRPEDADLNRILAGWWGKPGLPRGLAQSALGPLRGLPLDLDGSPIEADPAPVYPVVIVVDELPGWKVRLVRRSGIDEAFPNGILRMGGTLRPIGETQLDTGLKQRLLNGIVFQPNEAGRLVTAGGRVLDVVGRGPDPATARARAAEAIGHLTWPGMHHRTDIAAR